MDIQTDSRDGQKKYWGRWLGLTLGLTVLGLAALGGLVAVVDPFFHYHGPVKGLAYTLDSERYRTMASAGILHTMRCSQAHP